MSIELNESTQQLNASKQSWNEVIENSQLNVLKSDLTLYGFTIQFCYLSFDSFTARGVGKGAETLKLELSASYEALEYYLSAYVVNSYPVIICSLNQMPENFIAFPYRCKSDIFNHLAYKQNIPWVIYEEFKTKQNYLVPLVAVDLRYQDYVLASGNVVDYAGCEFYAASNGLASGASYLAAVEHAALEILERDAYSYLLIDLYLLNKPPLIVNHDSLPLDLKQLTHQIEKKFQNKVIILQTPSRFGVYAYIATFLDPIFEIQPRGGGASLDSHLALERALYELIQTHHQMHACYVDNTIEEDKLGNNTLLRNFMNFNVQEILSNKHQLIDFVDNAHELAHLTAEARFEQLLELIYTHSTLLVNLVYQHANGLSCVRAIIPETEEFFLGTHYFKLEPKAATALYIKDKLGREFSWADYEGD